MTEINSPRARANPRPAHSLAPTVAEQSRLSDFSESVLEKPANVLAHLMLPIRPVMPALRAPVVQRMPNSLAGEDFGQSISRAAVLPLTSTRADVNVARGELSQNPWIVQVSEIIHRIVEVEIVVVHSVHKVPNVVHAGHRKAPLDHVGMLEQRVGRVVRAERRAHRGNRDPRALAIIPNERNDLLAKVGVKNGLHVTPVKGMRAFVIKAESIDGIDAEEFYFPAVDEIGQRADQALAFEFRLIARARRKPENRLSPVAVDNHAHVEAQPRRIPAVIFTFHNVLRALRAGREYASPARMGAMELR